VKKFSRDAGIAIGPILFIIALLGILAAAISAGSGSFVSSTSRESSRSKAAALIEIGQNLRVGYDRVISYGEHSVGDIVINASNTSNTTDLFSPLGGGISPPSITLASDTQNDAWQYPYVQFPGLGTSLGCRVAMLHVDAGVCDEVNNKANAFSITATPGDTAGGEVTLGDLTSTGVLDATATDAWPAVLFGKPTGCFKNSDATAIPAGYYFYQVIAVQ
jgi:hypothetical protein